MNSPEENLGGSHRGTITDAAYQKALTEAVRGDDLIDVVREIVPELESITDRLKRHLDRLEEAERRARIHAAPDPPQETEE